MTQGQPAATGGACQRPVLPWDRGDAPNVKETESMAGVPTRSDAEAEGAGTELLWRQGCETVLVTPGERGVTLVERAGDACHIPMVARDVFDVTGAGDTTISVLALAPAASCAYRDAACPANVAAGIVVGKLGTTAVTAEELCRAVGARG
ncbi:MAG: PfkB family carbohydrate kinase [Deferrisomatales bacterium]|nr:PfkB family carbohydrate kinase [Deferrisomatales bacterium]